MGIAQMGLPQQRPLSSSQQIIAHPAALITRIDQRLAMAGADVLDGQFQEAKHRVASE